MTIFELFPAYKSFFVITYCRGEGHLHPNFKLEILTVFSILNPLFLPKMEILTLFSILNPLFLLKMEIWTLFSILNSLFLLKMEILTIFSILTSLFILKMEILTVFSILNKKIWETMSRLDKIDFKSLSLPRFLVI